MVIQQTVMEKPTDLEEVVCGIVAKHIGKQGEILSILEDIQARYRYLPTEALKQVAARTGRSLVDIYGVATFYRAFTLSPRGKHLCSVCMGTACHVRGAPTVLRALETELGIKPGETTRNKQFTLETVNCLGACALGPVVVVDGQYYSKVTPHEIEGILRRTLDGPSAEELANDPRIFPVDVSCARCNHSLMDSNHEIEGRPSVRVTVAFDSKHGWLRLSSLYGSQVVESEYHIPDDRVTDFFCPHCHAQLIGATPCPDCHAMMVPMIIRGGGLIQVCSRRGCPSHMLDLGGNMVR
jgi:NADH-quinone oxidoreductase subunit E